VAKIQRSALVMHSAKAMFGLVNDVRAYPQFLPWCSRAKVIREDADEVVARLSIAKGGIGHHFTTRNRLQAYQRIEMELVDGPFKYLHGAWQFKPLHDHACKVTLDLEFQFAGRLTTMALGGIFNHAANTMVDAFCQRANAVYG